MDIEIELKEAKKTLKEEEYKLRWVETSIANFANCVL
jgi:hypothetical protein